MNIQKLMISFIIICALGTAGIYVIQKQTSESITCTHEEITDNHVIEIDSAAKLLEIIQHHKQPSIIFFHMQNCSWCTKAQPFYYAITHKKQFESITFYEADGKALHAPSLIESTLHKKIPGFPAFLLIDIQGDTQLHIGFTNSQNLQDQITEFLLSSTSKTEMPTPQHHQEKHHRKKDKSNQKETKTVIPENNIIMINDAAQLEQALHDHTKNAVIFCTRAWCGWCEKAKPVFEELVKNPEFANITFYMINNESIDISSIVQKEIQEEIPGFPTFLFIGKQGYLEKQIGFLQKEAFENKLKSIFA